jgi:hypothetical protein
MQSALASLVKTSALPEKAEGSPASEADYTAKSSGQLMLWHLPGCSLKTAQPSEPKAGTSSLATLWRVDIPGETDSLPRLMSEPPTAAIDGGALHGVPTPTVCGNYNRKGASPTSGDGLATWAAKYPTPTASQMPCEGTVRLMRKAWLDGSVSLEDANAIAGRDVRKAQGKVPAFPTPLARDWKDGNMTPEQALALMHHPTLARVAALQDGGPLNPEWVEWLMGWPIGNTESKHWATAKSRSKRRSRGDCSVGHELV